MFIFVAYSDVTGDFGKLSKYLKLVFIKSYIKLYCLVALISLRSWSEYRRVCQYSCLNSIITNICENDRKDRAGRMIPVDLIINDNMLI